MTSVWWFHPSFFGEIAIYWFLEGSGGLREISGHPGSEVSARSEFLSAIKEVYPLIESKAVSTLVHSGFDPKCWPPASVTGHGRGCAEKGKLEIVLLHSSP